MTEFKVVTNSDLLKYTLFNRSRLAENGCWEWVGYYGSGGYGMMSRAGKNQRAHRISYEVYKGPIPKGMVVRHSCDNPACINPDHLTLGTQKDNVSDREARGRRVVNGEAIGTSKLSEKDVLEIRASTESNDVLAKRYGIDPSNVWLVRTGRSWRHIPSNPSH